MASDPLDLGSSQHGEPSRPTVLTLAEQVQLRVAAGTLLRRGLLVLEDEPARADVRVGTRGYRYLSQFWTAVGVLEGKAVSLDGEGEIDRARRRIAEEWIGAGAPEAWARQEADAALARLGVQALASRRAGARIARAPGRPAPRRPRKK